MILTKVVHYSKQLYRNAHGLLGLRSSDIWLTSFPRSGNSWFRVILANLLNLTERQGETVDLQTLELLAPSLGLSNLLRPWPYQLPRFVKTHQPYQPILFQKPKQAILLIRDPRDAMLSYFDLAQHSKILNFDQDFSDFIRHPRYGLYAWIQHYQSWVPNATITIYYEALRQDPQATVLEMFAQLQVKVDAGLVREAVERSALDNVKRQEVEHGIRDASRYQGDFRAVRHGGSRKWVDNFTEADLAYYQTICRQHRITIYQD